MDCETELYNCDEKTVQINLDAGTCDFSTSPIDFNVADLNELELEDWNLDVSIVGLEYNSNTSNNIMDKINNEQVSLNKNQNSIEIGSTEDISEGDPDYMLRTKIPLIRAVSRTKNQMKLIVEEKIVRRNKRQYVDETKWDVNKNKRKREDYFGKKKCNGVWDYKIPKKSRSLKEACNCKASQNGKTLQCKKFCEKERNEIFNYFWSELTWDQHKIYT